MPLEWKRRWDLFPVGTKKIFMNFLWWDQDLHMDALCVAGVRTENTGPEPAAPPLTGCVALASYFSSFSIHL